MTIARIVAGSIVYLGLVACASNDMARSHAVEPPCPNVISEREAVRIARELAHSQIMEYGGADARAEWHDAVWTVYLAERWRPSELWLDVRDDGRLIYCGYGVQCKPDPDIEEPTCAIATGKFIGKQEAGAIAVDYAARNNLAPVPQQVVFMSWIDAHWSVWFTYRGDAPVDSTITVFVSSDGFHAELFYPMEVPGPDSFFRQSPG